MDVTELLGGLLKNQAGAGGGLGKVLGQLLGGGKAAPAGGTRRPEPRRDTPRREPPRRAQDDYGRVARDAYAGGSSASRRAGGSRSELDDDRAIVLVRAMVNAAKADGQLDSKEQDTILSQLGEVTDGEIGFLRDEIAKPLDVREFAWSVPLGLEEQVYTFSLMAIGLDERKEASYLKDLAHGLRLRPEVCNAIHERQKAPKIF